MNCEDVGAEAVGVRFRQVPSVFGARSASAREAMKQYANWTRERGLGKGADGAVEQYATPDGGRGAAKIMIHDAIGLSVHELARRDFDHPNVDGIGGAWAVSFETSDNRGATASDDARPAEPVPMFKAVITTNLAVTTLNRLAVLQRQSVAGILRVRTPDGGSKGASSTATASPGQQQPPQHGATAKPPADDSKDMSVAIEDTPLSLDHLRIVVYQVLRAIEFIQASMIANPDVNGDNILIDEVAIPGSATRETFHRVRVTDFGKSLPYAITAWNGTAEAPPFDHFNTGTMWTRITDAVWRLAVQADLTGAGTAHPNFAGYVIVPGATCASALIRSQILCTRELTEATFRNACTADIPAGARYAQWTPAHFVESVLPYHHPVRPVDVAALPRPVTEPAQVPRNAIPTPESVLWGLLHRDRRHAPLRRFDTPNDRASYQAGMSDVLRTAHRYKDAFESTAQAHTAHRGPRSNPDRHTWLSIAIRAASLSSRCPWLFRGPVPPDGPADATTMAFMLIAQNLHTLHWDVIQGACKQHGILTQVFGAVATILDKLDYDVHHPTAAEYFHARCAREQPPFPAAAVLAGVQAIALALLDYGMALLPASELSRIALDACVCLVSGRARRWTPTRNEQDERRFVSLVRDKAAALSREGISLPEVDSAIGTWTTAYSL
jgi:hypothetical protein